VVVLDHLGTETSTRAAVAVAVAAPAESAGTWVNHELRAQRSFGFRPPRPEALAAWRLLSPETETLDDLLGALAEDLPALARVV
jgi:NADH-quinone oxidoreductase subunit G